MKNRSLYHKSVSKPVTIRGVTYPSFWQAAKAMQCSPENIRLAAKEGWLNKVGLKKQASANNNQAKTGN